MVSSYTVMVAVSNKHSRSQLVCTEHFQLKAYLPVISLVQFPFCFTVRQLTKILMLSILFQDKFSPMLYNICFLVVR